MAPIDRKALRQKMRQASADERARAKQLVFPLPDLTGPGGNAFNLLGVAQKLMRDAGISESEQAAFHSEATSGEYEHLLETIQSWFTVAVRDEKYVPIGDIDIKSLMRPRETEWPEDDPDTTEDLDTDLAAYEASAEKVQRDHDASVKTEADLRAELGLDPEDIVLIQIKRKKKANG